MAEAAEESGKENYRNGWPPGGRKFSEIDRESPAAREATEKENTAAAGSGRPVGGRFQRNTESPLNIRNIGLSCLERCLLPLAPCSAWPGVFSDRSARTRKTPQRRSRLKEEFRGRWGGGAIRPTSKHVASSPQTNSSAGLSAEVVSCRVS